MRHDTFDSRAKLPIIRAVSTENGNQLGQRRPTLNIDDITISNPPLVAAFQKYTTRVHASENFSFWFDKGNNEGKYAKYIKHGAPKELTLDNSG